MDINQSYSRLEYGHIKQYLFVYVLTILALSIFMMRINFSTLSESTMQYLSTGRVATISDLSPNGIKKNVMSIYQCQNMWPKHLNVSIVPIQNDYSIPLIYVKYLPTSDIYKYHQLLTKVHFLTKQSPSIFNWLLAHFCIMLNRSIQQCYNPLLKYRECYKKRQRKPTEKPPCL